MDTIQQKPTGEQVKDMLAMAEKVERVAAALNLSLRNHASPHTGDNAQSFLGDGSMRSLKTRPLRRQAA